MDILEARCRGLTRRLRRQFWEMCASRAPINIKRGIEGDHKSVESCAEIGLWADYMLSEWDKRWIVDTPSEESLAFLEEIKIFATRPDSETRNFNNEFHLTLYPQDAKLLLEAVGLLKRG